jgi:RNA-splicing ligase RtcB
LKFTKQDLLDAGWQNGPQLETIYQDALKLIHQKHIKEHGYLIKLLKRKHAASHATLCMKDAPAPLSLAIDAHTDDEVRNLEKALKQMSNLLKSPVALSGSLMPDACPAGSGDYTMPVGGVLETHKAIVPSAHSADICCSLHATFFTSECDTSEMMDILESVTRFGPGGRDADNYVAHDCLQDKVWNNPFLRRLEKKAQMHMADQGDGNHFAYLGNFEVSEVFLQHLKTNEYESLYAEMKEHAQLKVLVTHHGSRGFGSAVYKRGLDAAIKQARRHATNIPDEAAWLSMDSELGQEYWNALQYVGKWAQANHTSIHERFLAKLQAQKVSTLSNAHNYVWKRGDSYLHGKGATPAWRDANGQPLLGLIPLNMREPILISLGSDNTNYHSFSPHGAGRNLSRTALLKRYFHKRKGFNSTQLQADLQSGTHGIDARWYLGNPDISECPIAYKDAQSLRSQIAKYDLSQVIGEINPLGCIMAGRASKSEKPLSPKQLRQIQHRATRRKSRQRDWLNEM